MSYRLILMRINGFSIEYGDKESAKSKFERLGKSIGKDDILCLEKDGLVEDLRFTPGRADDRMLEMAAAIVEAILAARKANERSTSETGKISGHDIGQCLYRQPKWKIEQMLFAEIPERKAIIETVMRIKK